MSDNTLQMPLTDGESLRKSLPIGRQGGQKTMPLGFDAKRKLYQSQLEDCSQVALTCNNKQVVDVRQ